MAFINNPKIFYLGMQDQWYSFNMWWTRDAILGRIAIPDKKTTEADLNARIKAEKAAMVDHYTKIDYQGAYIEELMNKTDYPNFDISKCNEAFHQWKDHKKEDIMSFRDKSYVSAMTGTEAVPHHMKWKDCFHDLMDDFLSTSNAS